MGRVWKKHAESSRAAGNELEGKQRNKRELASGSNSKQAVPEAGHIATNASSLRAGSGSLPSEGIMAIYQQFRQIWRRQPQQARPFVHLPPQLLRQAQWRFPEDISLPGLRARGTAAAAA